MGDAIRLVLKYLDIKVEVINSFIEKLTFGERNFFVEAAFKVLSMIQIELHLFLLFIILTEQKVIFSLQKELKKEESLKGLSVQVVCGNAIPLLSIPLGTNVHNVEFYPGSGGKIARSAGTVVQLIARENGYATLFIPSGEIRQVAQNCWATIGQVGNVEHSNKKRGKAGRSRWLGRRPKVRGSAIKPVDHPHGGGEGRGPVGHRKPLTPWGKPRLGVKTRCPQKYSDSFILRR